MKKFSLLLVTIFAALTMSAQETKSSGVYAKSKAGENWYVTLGGGATMYFGDSDSKIDFTKRLGWTPKLTVGKWVTPVYGFRFALGVGTTNHYNDGLTRASHRNHTTDAPKYAPAGVTGNVYGLTFINTNLVMTYNLTNAIFSYNPDRIYNLIPYAGFGAMFGHTNKWKAQHNRSATVNIGMINDFKVCNSASIFVELEGICLQETMDFKRNSGMEWDFMGQATVGVKMNIGKSDFTELELMDYDLINDLNDQVNRLRAEVVVLAKRPESLPEPQIIEVVKEASVFVPSVVFFRLDSYVIDKNQEVNIYNTAEYLKANPSSKVKIVAYADRKTGNPAYNFKLSEKRAKVVAKSLTSKYGIDESRITIDWKGDVEQPYAENSWNRVAIFFAD